MYEDFFIAEKYPSVIHPLYVFTFWLLWIMLSWTFVYKFLYEHMCSLLLCIYLLLEFLANMVTVYIRFWGILALFSNVTVPICNTSSIRGSGYPHPCQGLLLSALILAILVGANCYLLVVLICAPESQFHCTAFHVLVGHLFVFLGEMPIQILRPF